ncbi:MAG: MFS transporter, partial [Bacteroidota bacterium]
LTYYSIFSAMMWIVAWPIGMLSDRKLGIIISPIAGAVLAFFGYLGLALGGGGFLTVSLILIIIGDNLFRISIISQAASFFPRQDRRRDGGLMVIYMFINFGAFLSTIGVGYVGEYFGFSWGFGVCALTMLLSLAFVLLNRYVFQYQYQAIHQQDQIDQGLEATTIIQRQKGRNKLIVIVALLGSLFWVLFEWLHMDVYEIGKDVYPSTLGGFWTNFYGGMLNALVVSGAILYFIVFWILRQPGQVLSRLRLAFILLVPAALTLFSLGSSNQSWLMTGLVVQVVILSFAELFLTPLCLSWISRLAKPGFMSSMIGLYFTLAGGITTLINFTVLELNVPTTVKAISGLIISLVIIGLLIVRHQRINRLGHGID